MNENIITELQNILEDKKVLTGQAVAERYHHIWEMDKPLQAKAVILPRNTQDVADTLKYCYKHHQKVVVHGGLTNLVGSTETSQDEVVISLEKLNQIEEVDSQSRTITVQAGVIIENIQNAAQANDLFFSLNFGAKGSAQIGGAIATNAGGLRVFRYGMTRNLVLGLEVVLADGTIISSMKKIIKDNSGYDLKQMFVGAEGTLGIITKAILKLEEAPKSRNSAFVGLKNYNDVVALLKFMDSGLSGSLSSFELIWQNTYNVFTSPADVKAPLPSDYPYYVLLDSLGSDQSSDHQAMETLLAEALAEGLIEDAAMAYTQSDIEWFWRIREDVHVLNTVMQNNGQHFDISLPIPLIGELVEKIYQNLMAINGVEECYTFGHVADGNIHFVVDKTNLSSELRKAIDLAVYSPLKAIGGSVSAEHGIGVHKRDYLKWCRNPSEIELMKLLKKTLDPRGILNQGKIFE
ncbi:MAG: FAD-binding oxidoreductase [Bacteroidota bacterium]